MMSPKPQNQQVFISDFQKGRDIRIGNGSQRSHTSKAIKYHKGRETKEKKFLVVV